MQVYYVDKVDSTQNLIKEYLSQQPFDSGIAIYTYHQFSGYGQGAHTWDCLPNQGIALSIAWPMHKNTDWIALNKHISTAITQYLQTHSALPIQLKWPNDLICQNRKLGGIIMQTAAYHQTTYLIIGIGFNYDLSNKHSHRIDLQEITDSLPPITTITPPLINHLHHNWLQADLNQADSRYQQILWGKSENVNVFFSKPEPTIKKCLFLGVDDAGRAILNHNQHIEHFHHGEVRILLDDR